MYTTILVACISAIAAIGIYVVVTNLVTKNSIRKRREAALKEAEAEGEMIKKERILLEGSIPSPVKPPDGCKFHTRCWMACDKCRRVPPPLAEIEPGHFVACHFPERKLDENGNYLFEMPKTEKKSAKE